ncbi:hypothetical protein M422DRAFT_778049, partial [Sphaerobolus stellatus SS14]
MLGRHPGAALRRHITKRKEQDYPLKANKPTKLKHVVNGVSHGEVPLPSSTDIEAGLLQMRNEIGHIEESGFGIHGIDQMEPTTVFHPTNRLVYPGLTEEQESFPDVIYENNYTPSSDHQDPNEYQECLLSAMFYTE